MLNIKKIKNYVHKSINMPPKQALRKAVKLLIRNCKDTYHYQIDNKHATFINQKDSLIIINKYFQKLSVNILDKDINQILSLANRYINHQFDILGSGWSKVKHGMNCPGLHGYCYKMGRTVQAYAKGHWLDNLINKSNLEKSKIIWSTISDAAYKAIDWQLDFKSGYRWSEKCWYKKVKYGSIPGVDVKVPWELSRMHHLVQFAFAYGITKENKYLQEYRCQTLDFIATNPPRYGVNWKSTMDVAIRIANWLIAYDFFVSCDAHFDNTFISIFTNSIYEHGHHIISNLEWNEELRGNHYLSNIVGLLFVAAYLPNSYETNLWLCFAVHELIHEVFLQFNSDGSNFEASTCYHRLSAEMVIYATALILGFSKNKLNALKSYDPKKIYKMCKIRVSKKPLYAIDKDDNRTSNIFPEKYRKRLEKMAEFTMSVSKINNQVSQIGDNDSGRFFKLQPVYTQFTTKEAVSVFENLNNYTEQKKENLYWFENHLDHRHLVAAINGIFNRDDFSTFTKGFYENTIISQLSNNTILASEITKNNAEKKRIGTYDDYNLFTDKYRTLLNQVNPIHFSLPEGYLKDLKLVAFHDFGLYIFRSNRFYLSVRCGSIGQKGNGGHAHNDQLSIELQVDGKDIIRDPGTYLYTPLPEMRNRYRSVMAHFTPFITNDISEITEMNLFTLKSKDSARCLYFGKKGFIGTHSEWEIPVFRVIQVRETGIDIYDFTINSNNQLVNNLNIHSKYVTFSDGYGIARTDR